MNRRIALGPAAISGVAALAALIFAGWPLPEARATGMQNAAPALLVLNKAEARWP